MLKSRQFPSQRSGESMVPSGLEVPFMDLVPAGIAEENMVKVLREKYDKRRSHIRVPGSRGWWMRIPSDFL